MTFIASDQVESIEYCPVFNFILGVDGILSDNFRQLRQIQSHSAFLKHIFEVNLIDKS